MHDDRLSYLHDHLAGARFAIELLTKLSRQDVDSAVASSAAWLLAEITADRAALETIVESIGGDANTGKDVAAWIAEKAVSFKLDVTTYLGIFEVVEVLSLGVQGKLALWNALAASAGRADTELERLKSRAVGQHVALEQARLTLAVALLGGWDRQPECRQAERALEDWAKGYGIEVKQCVFALGQAGEFDGTTVVMNSTYAADERLYYAVHAIGSIVIWSHDRDGVQQLFDELRDAEKQKSADPGRLSQAIERYRAFETESSQYAVWILGEIDASSLVPAYSNFMRADLEAMTIFHQTGKAPVWKEFFARWNVEVAAGKRQVEPFEMRPAADFHAIAIETQQILQQQ